MITRQLFVVCVSAVGCDDLTTGKVYRSLPDEPAARDGFIRVVDDSGEDYLYPMARFAMVEVQPGDVPRVLEATSASLG